VPKEAPSFARVGTMVLFALSCFGLLLFLWLSFGGAVPLKPQGYRVQVALPDAQQLANQADVRVAGVSVGKVVSKQLDASGSRTVATLELDPRFSPLRSDAHAILRQKTLLGENYVELTPGTHATKAVPDGGRLPDGNTAPAVTLDQIFGAFDPTTRAAFQSWQRDLAKGFLGHGQDFSAALGNLPDLAQNGTDVLSALDSEKQAVQQLIHNTGTVFAAVTQNEGQLRKLVTTSEQVFSATAQQNQALSQSFAIFPTFLDQSKLTFTRLKAFALNTKPLLDELRPPLRDLGPTLRDVKAFAPDLRTFVLNLDALTRASVRGLPALRGIINGIRPLLGSVGPFTEQFNPILQFLQLYQHEVIQFLDGGGSSTKPTTSSIRTLGGGPGPGHYLRQFGPLGAESIGAYSSRLASNRGNAYFGPNQLIGPKFGRELGLPSFDCNNTGGEVPPSGHQESCYTGAPYTLQGVTAKFHQLQANPPSAP